MNWKKFGRVLVCLALVCCILVNASPIKAKAAATTTGLSLLGMMIALMGGVALQPQTAEEFDAIGQSFSNSLTTWGKVNAMEEVIEVFLSQAWDDWVSNPRPVNYSAPIKSAITGWIISLIVAGGVEIGGEVAPDSWSYYGDLLLPTFRTYEGYPYCCILENDGAYNVIHSSAPFRFSVKSGKGNAKSISATNFIVDYVYKRELETWDPYNSKYSRLGTSSPTAAGVLSPAYNATIVWANFDVYYYNDGTTLVCPGSSVADRYGTVLSPALVGAIPGQVENGELTQEDFEKKLPYTIDPTSLLQDTSKESLNEALQETIAKVIAGEMTYEEYMESVRAETLTDTEVIADTLANTSVASFVKYLVNALTFPLQNVADVVLTGIRAIFVPSEDYLTEKVEALAERFAFVAAIVKTAQALKTGLAGVSTEPPVIYLDLGASRGSYYLGGTVPFLDLRWYAEYKPTVDAIISAFLWICFVWRMLIKLPGIISGMPGDFVAGVAHDMGVTSAHLPTRSADFERQRVELRQSLWKGRK